MSPPKVLLVSIRRACISADSACVKADSRAGLGLVEREDGERAEDVRLPVALRVAAQRRGRSLRGDAVGVEDDVLEREPHEAVPEVLLRVGEVHDGRRHAFLTRALLVADAAVEEGDGGGDALHRRRARVGEHPDVAQAVVLGVGVAERVAQDADERHLFAPRGPVVEPVELAEDGQELRVAADGYRLDAEGRGAGGLAREHVLALQGRRRFAPARAAAVGTCPARMKRASTSVSRFFAGRSR